MSSYDRREFLGKVGVGMLVSAGGWAVADELDLITLIHADETDRLSFGKLEPLVALLQETQADALMPKLKAQLEAGVDLPTLATAAALANARTFGGQDYTGYHCFMAIVPALAMARRLPDNEAALPIFKVLHRNARRIQAQGGRRDEVLRRVQPAAAVEGDAHARLLAAGRKGEFDSAEATFAKVATLGPKAAYASLQPLVRDNIDVHQVVLAYRSWDMLRLAGEQNAQVLLRQVLRHCIDRDEGRRRRGRRAPAIRELLPELIETHGLDRSIARTKRLSAGELEEVAQVVFASGRDDAARHVATLLGQGVARDDIGEALSIASVRLLLHDPGRSSGSDDKPRGSVHGASVGVHAADSANAWRGIADATEPSNANACLVTAAWHTAGQSGHMNRSTPHHASAREAAEGVVADRLLGALAETMRGRDQTMSAALAERYGKLGGDPEELIATLIEPAVRFDGALHHEKYFLTATEEFARTRPEARWDHLVALARVMASGYGYEAPGLDLSRRVLGV